MKFSVIIPVYNTEKFLSECLDSVINQSYSDLEIIIINDGSPDNSDEICRRYAARDQRIKYIIQANQGVAVARNNGIAAAVGDYIYCVDSDDSIALDFFAVLAAEIEADPADLIIIGTEFCRIKIENLGAVATNGIAVKAGFLKKYPDVRFAEKMHPGEDGIFAHKALALAESVAQCPDACYFYRRDNENSVSNTMTPDKTIDMLHRFFSILPEFYDKYHLWEKKKFHLLAFIKNEPHNRLRFATGKKKQIFDIIHKFVCKYQLNKFSRAELTGAWDMDFYYMIKSCSYFTYRAGLFMHKIFSISKIPGRERIIVRIFGIKLTFSRKTMQESSKK